MKIFIEAGLTELIPSDSYVNKTEYKQLWSEYQHALNQYLSLEDELNSIPVHLKPQDQWSELEEFMYTEFRIAPKLEDSEDVKQLKSLLKTYQQMYQELKSKIDELTKQAAAQRQANKSFMLPEPTTKRNFEGFTTKSTGIPFYDNFLDKNDIAYMRKHKHLDGYIASMSPVDYLEGCADIFNSTLEVQIYSTQRDNIEKYAKMMRNGTKFNMPVLNYAQNTQEGRHRAQAAYMNGIKEIPVLIIVNC